MSAQMVENNIKEVLERIAAAARLAGRCPEDITLIGVTKTQGIAEIAAMAGCGVTNAGENRVQELLEKYPSPALQGLTWHMIGHLQTNKVKYIVDKVRMIHSLDSLGLAEEIHKRAQAAGRVMDALIEVNIAGEDTKFGVSPEKLPEFAESIAHLSQVRLRGLMCVAPITQKPHENRKFFHKMYKLGVDISKKFLHNDTIDVLSMGMTQDYEEAIMEGATMVRVGTGIFGSR